jgi:hypothetical protein
VIPQEVSDRLAKVLDVLRQRTMDGVIDWPEVGPERYQTSVERSSFMVGTRDSDGIGPYVFGMYNSQGTPVAIIDSADEDYPQGVRVQISELYTLVSTSAAQVMNFLDRALKELEDLPPF